MGRLWLTGAEVDASCLDMATVKWSEWKPQGHRHTRDLLTVISECMRQNTWPLCIHPLPRLQTTANQRVLRLIMLWSTMLTSSIGHWLRLMLSGLRIDRTQKYVFTGDIYIWWVIMFLLLCLARCSILHISTFQDNGSFRLSHVYISWPNQWHTRVDCLAIVSQRR